MACDANWLIQDIKCVATCISQAYYKLPEGKTCVHIVFYLFSALADSQTAVVNIVEKSNLAGSLACVSMYGAIKVILIKTNNRTN